MNGTFESRHLGPNEKEIKQMLDVIGADSIATLLSETIPKDIALNKGLNLPDGITEHEFLTELQLISQKNKLFDTYIGLGYHPTITPAVIQRNILENPGWYTAYTPYQAEIAQGRLEALFNFQTVVTDLTGMELANASLLDESTAAAEAMTLLFAARSRDQKKNNSCLFFVSEDVLPQTLALFKTRAEPIGIQLVVGNADTFDFNTDFFGAFFQYPGKHGAICNLPELVKKAQAFDIKTVVAADLLSLTLLEAPGNYGVDAVVGTTQRFGIPLGYGGPHAAYFATREAYKRNLPGRIIGQTRDLDGAPALRMALQTREQHIKRDKATSNICTAQVLLAVMAGMYAVYHGPKELKNIATKIHLQAVRFEAILEKLAIEQLNKNYFDTLLIKADATRLTALAEAHEINLLAVDADHVAIAFNETVTEKSFAKLVGVFEEYTKQKENLNGQINFDPILTPIEIKFYFKINCFKVISKYIQGEVLKCNMLGESTAFGGGWSSCPENNPNRLTMPAYNSLKDKFKNPFNTNDSAVWAYGNFSGRAAWTPGATIIAAFYINGIGTLYISTCFEEQCYPTDPGPNPPVYGPGVLTSAIPLN